MGFENNSEKDTNPKDALGIKKAPMHCVSAAVLMEVGLAMMEGGRKYGAHNYRAMGVRGSVYYDAALRHLMDWWEGQDIDPASGLHHVAKAMACLTVLRDSMLMENWEDDRPIRLPDGLGIGSLNERAEGIIKQYPECKLPFTQARLDMEQERADRVVGFGNDLSRAGYDWDGQEVDCLRSEVSRNLSLEEIAHRHQRTFVAITSRMEKLNIEFKPEVKHEEGKLIAADTIYAGSTINPDKLCGCATCQTRRIDFQLQKNRQSTDRTANPDRHGDRQADNT
jgi:hypothetical protein